MYWQLGEPGFLLFGAGGGGSDVVGKGIVVGLGNCFQIVGVNIMKAG